MNLEVTHPTHLAAGRLAGSLPLATSSPAPGDPRFDFFDTLRDAVREVNASQNAAQARVQAFQLGQPGVTLEDVIISMQKSGLAFQGMVAVRNKLVEAYREISNMQV
jgi:flagellar hook-basal body complex protein FliE